MSDPSDDRPIRVMVFPARRDVLLVYVPEGQELWLPRLPTPFDRYDVATRLRNVEIEARVAESTVGRFGPAVEKMVKEDRDFAHTQQQLVEARSKVKLTFATHGGAPATVTDKRAALIADKTLVDRKITTLKAELANAPNFETARRKGAELNDLKTMSQALQYEIGKLREAYNAEHAIRNTGKNSRFVNVARRVLPAHVFQEIWDEVQKLDEADRKVLAEHESRERLEPATSR